MIYMDGRTGYSKCSEFMKQFKPGQEMTVEEFATEISKVLASDKFKIRRYLMLMQAWGMIKKENNVVSILKPGEKVSDVHAFI